MFIRLFYFLLYIFILVHCKIEIRDANVAVLSRDEIGMIFYITVQNTNTNPYEVKVNMIECTEVLSEKDRDPNFMYLIGGYMGVIKPHCFKNLTVIYPNMYIHNRRGYCLISIKFKSENDELIQRKANITFDTYITRKGGPYIMKGFYNKAELTKCDSIDQDPLKHCKPVDCQMKYLGTRNYFNRRLKRCQKVPLCITDATKEMPNIIYSPVTNKCRNMERVVTKDDLEAIESGIPIKNTEDMYTATMNIDCHFGKFNNNTGNCDCYEGWTSAPVEKDRGPPSGLFVYHMCNIEATDWYDTDSRKLKVICLTIGILSVLLAMLIILCAFLIQMCYNCIKSFENCTSFSDSKSKNQDPEPKNKKCGTRRKKKSKEAQTGKSKKEQKREDKGNNKKGGGNKESKDKSSKSSKSSQSSRSQSKKSSKSGRTTSAATSTDGSSKTSKCSCKKK